MNVLEQIAYTSYVVAVVAFILVSLCAFTDLIVDPDTEIPIGFQYLCQALWLVAVVFAVLHVLYLIWGDV